MFKLITSDRPGYLSAVISDDNLIISWADNLSEPPWNDLYMERYHDEFMAALNDWGLRK